MKKNNFKVFILGVFVLLLCTACDGNITRAIRHDGFAAGAKINCNIFFPEQGQSMYAVKFFTGSHIIDTNDRIY